MGLFAASILPTISLIIGAMGASGRSVKGVNELHNELAHAVDALLFIFGTLLVSVAALFALSVPTPNAVAAIPLAGEILTRGGQAIVSLTAVTALLHAGKIPAILRRILELRREMAVNEVRRQISERAPAAGAMRENFATSAGFGRSVSLEEAAERRQH
ncbi:MAG: hypothetical protein CMN72_07930 [Sphingomonas sp.]|nr:hypothetical protein [Sphingomonas sp.]